jgi:hypothetical protein
MVATRQFISRSAVYIVMVAMCLSGFNVYIRTPYWLDFFSEQTATHIPNSIAVSIFPLRVPPVTLHNILDLRIATTCFAGQTVKHTLSRD